MFAIANALEGMSLTEVARLAGMARQAVRAGDASRLDRSDEPVPRRGQPPMMPSLMRAAWLGTNSLQNASCAYATTPMSNRSIYRLGGIKPHRLWHVAWDWNGCRWFFYRRRQIRIRGGRRGNGWREWRIAHDLHTIWAQLGSPLERDDRRWLHRRSEFRDQTKAWIMVVLDGNIIKI